MTSPELMKRVREAHKPSLQPYWTREKNVVVCSQNPDGRSAWANWVRLGLLGQNDIVWVFEQVQGRRRWLFLSLDTGRGSPLLFDIRHKEGQDDLRRMERRMEKYFHEQMEQAEKEAFSTDYVHEVEDAIQWDNLNLPGWPSGE